MTKEELQENILDMINKYENICGEKVSRIDIFQAEIVRSDGKVVDHPNSRAVKVVLKD